MAVVVNSDASALKRTANLPAASTAYSIYGWFMLTADRNAFSGLVGIANSAGGASYHQLCTDSDGTTLNLYRNGITEVLLRALSLNTWYFVAMTCSGTGAGTLIGYVRALTENTFTTASLAGNSFTPGAAEWGRDTATGEFITGRVESVGLSDLVLSADELLAISFLSEPHLKGIRGLNCFFPCKESVNTNVLVDRSGNGRNATATVGALADGAPLWMAPAALYHVANASSGPTPIEGDLAVTEGADTFAASAIVEVQGSLAVTEGADTAAVSAIVEIQGSLAVTEGADTFAASAVVEIQGSLAVTEGADTFAASAIVEVQGSLAVSEGADTAAVAAVVEIQGALAVTEGADTFAATIGSVPIQAALAVTEGADTFAASAIVEVQGSLAVTEGADTFAATSGAVPIEGALAVTEGADTIAIAANVRVIGSLAVTEGTDTFAAAVAVGIEGSMAVTEAADTFEAVELPDCVPLDFDTEEPDLDDMIGVAFLDRFGRFAKTNDAVAVVRVFYPDTYCDTFGDLTLAEFNALPSDTRTALRNGPSAAGLVVTEGKSNA